MIPDHHGDDTAIRTGSNAGSPRATSLPSIASATATITSPLTSSFANRTSKATTAATDHIGERAVI